MDVKLIKGTLRLSELHDFIFLKERLG